jgi:hypothetical protein
MDANAARISVYVFEVTSRRTGCNEGTRVRVERFDAGQRRVEPETGTLTLDERGHQMMLAVSALDPTIRAILFGVAVVLFALAAVGFERGKVGFLAAGLAVFAFPFFWDALAAS